MQSRESRSNKPGIRSYVISAAAVIVFLAVAAAAIWHFGGFGYLTLKNEDTGEVYARYLMRTGEEFSVGFVHSVNKSPVIDCYELRDDGIYVVKTIYYGFGAGVQTELEDGQTLEYGEDGSMIVSGFNRKISSLIYCVGVVSDHTLTLREEREISLRDLCGRSSMVRFEFDRIF